MLIKLLATNIVANNLLGLRRSEITLFFGMEISSLSLSSNDLTWSEKKRLQLQILKLKKTIRLKLIWFESRINHILI